MCTFGIFTGFLLEFEVLLVCVFVCVFVLLLVLHFWFSLFPEYIFEYGDNLFLLDLNKKLTDR